MQADKFSTMVVMHILPPSITVVINLINALLYQHRVIPMLYSVLLIPVMFLGWVASLTIWVLCYQADENGPDCTSTLTLPTYSLYLHTHSTYQNKREIKQVLTPVTVCYQTLLTPFAYPDGISDSINFGFTLVTAVLLALYVFYFALAARDYYTWVKAGSPAMPATIHELEGRRQEEREATELARSLRSHPKDRYDAFREALAQNQRSGVPGYERCTLRG